MATNLQTVNRMIADKYPGIELVQGVDCCYFKGADTSKWKTNKVSTFRVQNLTPEEWMEELDYLVKLYRHEPKVVMEVENDQTIEAAAQKADHSEPVYEALKSRNAAILDNAGLRKRVSELEAENAVLRNRADEVWGIVEDLWNAAANYSPEDGSPETIIAIAVAKLTKGF